MKILITGGAGYLGSVITEKMLKAGHSVTSIDNLLFKQLSPLQFTSNPNYNFIYGDVRNVDFLKHQVGLHDVIIPLAAIVGFPACKADPKLAWEVNYTQIETILDSITDNHIVLYPNTNSGYGIGEGQTECTEESPLNPISVYGESKCAAEKLLLECSSAICFRLATVFGTSTRMRTDLLVNEFVYKAMTDKYITVFEKHFKRNFIHLLDVVQAFELAIENPEHFNRQIFNVGLSSANISKIELCQEIAKLLPSFYFSEASLGEDPDKRNYIVSNQKIESLGFMPRVSLQDGIAELIKGLPLFKHNYFSNI
jgi:nucleoside-diphosphate-sugar epimerase